MSSAEQESPVRPAGPVQVQSIGNAGSRSRLRSSGAFAILAGLLWAVGVGTEIVLRPQRPDGSVAAPVLFTFVTAAGLAGSLFLVLAFRGLRASVLTEGRASAARAGRAARAGSWCCVAGAVLLLVFAAASLVSGLAAGAVWEPSFLAFALGMLVLLGGQLALGLAVRRHDVGAGGMWPCLVLGSACIVVALVVPADPWHDLGLFGLFAAWVALGSGLLLRARA